MYLNLRIICISVLFQSKYISHVFGEEYVRLCVYIQRHRIHRYINESVLR